jgi:putative ABC transport system permease protein
MRYAARTLWRSPGFTLAALAMLALGIGANIAVYSVLRGVLLKPLGYPAEERLLHVTGAKPARNAHDLVMSVPEYDIIRHTSRAFEDAGAYLEESCNLTGGATPESVRAICATPNLLSVLGVTPALGRPFTAEEADVGAAPVVLLSHSVWRRQFAGDPAVIGRVVMLNDVPNTVIGVLPAWFEVAWGERLLGKMGIWTPFPDSLRREPEGSICLRVIGRLRPHVTSEDARADLANLAAAIQDGERNADPGWTLESQPLIGTLVGQNHRAALLALMGAVVVVLIIACVNVASLMLARGSSRATELAVRAALGGSRAQLVRHVLTECALLTFVGAAVSILLATWGVSALTNLLPADFPRRNEIALDAPVLLFAVGLSVVTCLLCGLGPALRCSGVSLNAVLQAGTQTLSTSRWAGHRRDILVVGQVTLAVALLACAGLMIRTIRGLSAVDPGFDPEHVLTMRAELSWTSAADWRRFPDFYMRSVQEIRRLPGVTAVGGVSSMPMSDGSLATSMVIEGYEPPEPEQQPSAGLVAVTPGYFAAMGILLHAGRDVSVDDTGDSPLITLVSESFVERYWPNRNPLGRHVTVGSQECTVVGVVGDVRHWGLDTEVDPQMYFPITQRPWPRLRFVVRTTGDPAAATQLVQQAIWSVDPDQPVCAVQSMREVVNRSIGVRSTLAGLLTGLGAVSLVLTGLGVAGVIAYTVARRTREIGIRIAFGATSRDILHFIGRRYVLLAAIGLLAGTGLTLLVSRLLESLLFNVSPHDPQTLLMAVVVVAAAALLAGYLPARGATKVDPMIALRCE